MFETLKSIFSDRRMQVLLVIVLVSILHIYLSGVKFGIDFAGGTRIPIVLERSVNNAEMDMVVNVLKERLSKFGLKEVKVKSLGDRDLYVEVSGSDTESIAEVERLIATQGVFQAVVDGKVAISGDELIKKSIYTVPFDRVSGNADYEVAFTITPEAGPKFANAVLGKADYPLYMYLDRPSKSMIVLTREEMLTYAGGASPEQALEAIDNATRLDDYPEQHLKVVLADDFANMLAANATIPVSGPGSRVQSPESRVSRPETQDSRPQSIATNNATTNTTVSSSGLRVSSNGTENPKLETRNSVATTTTATTALSGYSRIITSERTKSQIEEVAATYNYSNFTVVNDTDITPYYSTDASGSIKNVDKWAAAGLLSAPILNPGVTKGTPGLSFVISGSVRAQGTDVYTAAQEESKRIENILRGGALPVKLSLGSKTTIPAPLGQEFLRLSMIVAVISLALVGLTVGIRYRMLKIVLPILFISLSEAVILVAIIGSLTIDLSAMAGIIAAIGIGVDAQIVITDQMLKKGGSDLHGNLDKAFTIIWTNVAVATAAMVPLLFSGMIEIVGFATSTILGYLLGVLISRPAYGTMLEHIFEKQIKTHDRGDLNV